MKISKSHEQLRRYSRDVVQDKQVVSIGPILLNKNKNADIITPCNFQQ